MLILIIYPCTTTMSGGPSVDHRPIDKKWPDMAVIGPAFFWALILVVSQPRCSPPIIGKSYSESAHSEGILLSSDWWSSFCTLIFNITGDLLGSFFLLISKCYIGKSFDTTIFVIKSMFWAVYYSQPGGVKHNYGASELLAEGFVPYAKADDKFW